LIGKGRVIGVDIEIRPHNRTAMEEHPLSSLVTMIEADSVAPATIEQVRSLMKPGETALVILDSHHLRDHVLAELRAYAEFVTPGSYIVATDGIMGQVVGGPRTQPDWSWNNPKEAAAAFVAENPDFSVVEPQFPFNEGVVTERVTYWPGAYVRRDR
jgi:cephalosporin hydroxylase